MTRLLKLLTLALVLTVALALLPGGPAAAVAQDHSATPAAGQPAAAPAHGDHPVTVLPAPKEALIPMITSLVVFVVVLGILGRFAWPKINKGLTERENKIREEIAAAEAARKQARDALEQYEHSLADARAEAQKMLEKTKAQQLALAEELKAKAEIELTAMKERARRDIEAAKRAALSEIFEQTATLATTIASKILQREVNPRDQQRLMQESVAELGSSRA